MSQKNQITTETGNEEVTPQYIHQATIQYKTFLKRMIVEALQNAFKRHPDAWIAKSKIGIEYPTDRADFPAIIVKFYERDMLNAGVGHVEYGPSPTDPNYPEGPEFKNWVKYHHRIYKGDLEFDVMGLQAVDRDKMVDALIEVLAMEDVTPQGKSFQERVYESIENTPFADQHFVALNTDLVQGYGEQQEIAPWIPEDTLLYKSTYRIPVFGEFYSLTPSGASSTSVVEKVQFYPWDSKDPADTPPEKFPNEEIPAVDFLVVTKHEGLKEAEEGT